MRFLYPSGVIVQRVPTPVLLLLALAGGGALGSCESAPGATYQLSGRVTVLLTDDGAAMPIGGALVRFTSDTGRVGETTTGGDGRYELAVFTDAPFGQVRAEANGYTPNERTVYWDQPERRIDIVLRPAAPEM